MDRLNLQVLTSKSESRFRFGTKAETLERLAGVLGPSNYPTQYYFSVDQWLTDRGSVLRSIVGTFEGACTKVIVRSSARDEDAAGRTMAGAYESRADVSLNHDELVEAVEAVTTSYGRIDGLDQVLVQPMISDVAISGVMFTGDIQSGGPYFSINYDDWSGSTNTITSGRHGKLLLIRQGTRAEHRNARLNQLLPLAITLQNVTTEKHLDIEFCIRKNEDVVILQVRQLTAVSGLNRVRLSRFSYALATIKEQLRAGFAREDGIFGERAVFSDMADWNPAEMIGTVPSPLALSLYESLVTDSVWAEARAMMGYAKVNGPLLVSLAGRPYIDVRRSLNSLLPASTTGDFAERLIEFQLHKLKMSPALHDKLEFEVAITCFDFNLDGRFQELENSGLSEADLDEFRSQLLLLTRKHVEGGAENIASILSITENLLTDRNEISAIDNPKVRAFRLLASVREYGTLPFAILARHGFVAASLLRSLVAKNAISPAEAERFMRSLSTVTSRLLADLASYSNGQLSLAELLAEYGFLRPGTYDIASPRYDETPERISDTLRAHPAAEKFSLSRQSQLRVETLLQANGFQLSCKSLFDYLAAAIAAREESKFRFTRSLSDALSNLAMWGERLGLTREDISHLSLDQIRDTVRPAQIREEMAESRYRLQTTRMIRLPNLICDEHETDIIEVPLAVPNFITGRRIVGAVKELTPDDESDIEGKIVLIEKADPGYDWIFSKRISGLVTMYGGANSHMAIRCAEFGLPAAIGCGSRIYAELQSAKYVELDCHAQVLRASSL